MEYMPRKMAEGMSVSSSMTSQMDLVFSSNQMEASFSAVAGEKGDHQNVKAPRARKD